MRGKDVELLFTERDDVSSGGAGDRADGRGLRPGRRLHLARLAEGRQGGGGEGEGEGHRGAPEGAQVGGGLKVVQKDLL